MSSSPSPKSLWSEYKNPQGRVYWSHSQTKQSVWEKPDELKTAFEKALAKTPWKQYISKGRAYYVHGETKETKWDLPDELQRLKERVERAEQRGGREGSPDNLRATSNNALTFLKSEGRPLGATPVLNLPVIPPEDVITFPMGGFLTHEKAVEGFQFLLRREGVDEHWTWDQAMRKVIMDPLYKALETLAQKKAAFELYQRQIVLNRQADKEARIAKTRPILFKLFAATPQIKSYSTHKTGDKVLAKDRPWRDTPDDERRLLLDEYTRDLRLKEETNLRETRTTNIQTLTSLLPTLSAISISTPFREAHSILLDSSEYSTHPTLRQIETIDILSVYDDYTRTLEREHEDARKKYQTDLIRRGRKAREGFRGLLEELVKEGVIKRGGKWKHVYGRLRGEERYTELVGLQGSNPLELWMDVVDDLEVEVDEAKGKVERGLKGVEKVFGVDTTWEEFEGWVKDVVVGMEDKLMRDVYDLMHEKLIQELEDEKRRAERKRRHRIDDLRYALKKVSRHIDLDMTYEEAEPFMKDLDEFKDVTQEEDRKSAFEKYIKRQKEKMREAESSDMGSERRYSTTKRRDEDMDVDEKDDREKDRAKDKRSKRDDRPREKERKDRSPRKERDRSPRREKERGDDKDRKGGRERGERRREKSRERGREKKHVGSSVEPDDRDYKKRRMSSVSRDRGKEDKEEIEEGEI